MKSFKILTLAIASLAITTIATAQTKTESFKVAGNCGMCKTKIEKAAKDAGASTATWDADKQEITIKYNSATTNTAKIQQKIAGVGYDNAGFKTTVEAYNKLMSCCKYERTEASNKMDCCKDGKCSMPGHDGKDCCKDGAATADCCKDGKCEKHS